MKITSLIDDAKGTNGLINEHGLSLYIESGSKKIIFDMGQSDAFASNAFKLGIDISKVDAAVISHGHYDHGGGLSKFLELNKKASVFINEHAFEPHYNGTDKYIGLDRSISKNNRLKFVSDNYKIYENTELLTCNTNKKYYPIKSSGLNMIKDLKYVPDDFKHEQYLQITENGKKILISGCSHKGILNIMKWFSPDVLIGGFHFKNLMPDSDSIKLSETAQILSHYNTSYYTCHCTGIIQYEYIKKEMKDKLNYLTCGQTIHI